MLRWYLIHTKPSGETVARENLERQGYEVYLPRVVEPVRRGGLWSERICALFPRYLFLRLIEGTQALAPVRSSFGVSGVVRFGARYAIVADKVVDALRSRESGDGVHRLVRPPKPVPGERVRLESGPFEGFEGIFEREAGADRVVVLLNLLGQDAHVRVPASFVIPRLAV
jgi:transcriptional antiterminator RfaH